jgi:hypothetical protein
MKPTRQRAGVLSSQTAARGLSQSFGASGQVIIAKVRAMIDLSKLWIHKEDLMGKLPFVWLLFLSITSLSARAQIMTNPVQDYINKTNILNNILSNKRATDMSQKAQTRGRSTDRSRTNSPVSTDSTPSPAQTKFNPTPRPLLPRLLAERSANTPTSQREAEQFFTSLVGLYEQTARKDGFPANDLAYAFEYFIVNSYMTYHDLHDVAYDKDPRVKRGKDMFDRLTIISEKKLLKVTLDQERAVYDQIKTLLAGNPEVQRMTDQKKQELTELLVIMFGVNYTAYIKGVNSEDERLIGQARQTAKGYLERVIGVPVERIRISNEGLGQ